MSATGTIHVAGRLAENFTRERDRLEGEIARLTAEVRRLEARMPRCECGACGLPVYDDGLCARCDADAAVSA